MALVQSKEHPQKNSDTPASLPSFLSGGNMESRQFLSAKIPSCWALDSSMRATILSVIMIALEIGVRCLIWTPIGVSSPTLL